jgi:hypothetical protein
MIITAIALFHPKANVYFRNEWEANFSIRWYFVCNGLSIPQPAEHRHE